MVSTYVYVLGSVMLTIAATAAMSDWLTGTIFFSVFGGTVLICAQLRAIYDALTERDEAEMSSGHESCL